jgi:integrase
MAHRDWGEAQGNYDEFRLFTGMRPSEEIALALSDVDLANGTVSVNKARVAGIDRDQTKTGDDRRITLCPRALAVLKRQLSLRARLEATGAIRNDYVFFRKTGEPFRNLQIQARRWCATLTLLKLRYRRPCVARQFLGELEYHDRQEPVVGLPSSMATASRRCRGCMPRGRRTRSSPMSKRFAVR